ncbi:fatty acid desaturase [Hyaloraphidium curvatum]|nr:fatty acid desaturase [Hyaloraphidium curvatum]
MTIRREKTPAAMSLRLEWATLGLIGATWGAFVTLTLLHAAIPLWTMVLAGAYIVALHNSLQHEATHGHPTSSSTLNEALVSVLPISLWFPFRRFKKLHLQHHRDENLTDPAQDPESYYFDPQAWASTPGWLRAVYTANNTLAGRLILGPALVVIRFWPAELLKILQGDGEIALAWAVHLAGIALLRQLLRFCGMDFAYFILAVAYPGNSLTLLRSFVEHRAHHLPGGRTAIVEAHPAISLLFLHNNLHAAHHEKPSMPWYEIPRYYRENKERLLAENSGYFIDGYSAIALRWLFVPKEPIEHPLLAAAARGGEEKKPLASDVGKKAFLGTLRGPVYESRSRETIPTTLRRLGRRAFRIDVR